MTKATIRKQLRALLEDIASEQFGQKSDSACEKLCQRPEFGQAKTIMMFLSLPHEIDTSVAIRIALETGKRVLVPAVCWGDKSLKPVIVSSVDCEMKEDRYALRHPADERAVAISEIDLVVVPGLGFDNTGNRLGRGGGFYDRLLGGDDFKGVSCGLALEEQVLDEIPVNSDDMKIDMLVTDKKMRKFNSEI